MFWVEIIIDFPIDNLWVQIQFMTAASLSAQTVLGRR